MENVTVAMMKSVHHICITYDFDSRDDKMVTVRDRDTMEQTRLPIAELVNFIQGKIQF